jgi:hypothetical protein
MKILRRFTFLTCNSENFLNYKINNFNNFRKDILIEIKMEGKIVQKFFSHHYKTNYFCD